MSDLNFKEQSDYEIGSTPVVRSELENKKYPRGTSQGRSAAA